MSDHKIIIMVSKYSTNNDIDTGKSLSLISKRKIKSNYRAQEKDE